MTSPWRSDITRFCSKFSIVAVLCGFSGLIWAEDVIEIDHLSVSPAGFKVATISVKSQGLGWIAETDKCIKSEKFRQIEPQPDGFRAIIGAESLIQGKNQLFVCFPKAEGADAEAKPIVINRDDATPKITLKPNPGEFGRMPEIQIESDNALVSYTVNDKEPQFDTDGKLKMGEKFTGSIRPQQKVVTIRVRAISAAGVVSSSVQGEYSENKRLIGWNEWDLYLGGTYTSTAGSVNSYLPTGFGLLAGARRGLDDFFAPNNSDINNRSWWLPGLFAEGQFLRLSNNPYSENLITFIAGPEWQFAITRSRNLIIASGIGAGISQISVNTPTYNSSGITTALQGKIAVEYHLRTWAVFAQIRYSYFADQSSPLSSVGFLTGLIYKI